MSFQDKHEYLIKWKGYSIADSSWEPEIFIPDAEESYK